MNILEHDGAQTPEYYPNHGHNPTRARDAVENVVFEADFVEDTAQERASGEAKGLANDEPASQSRPPANTNDTRIRTVAFTVQERDESQPGHHSTYENQIEPVRPICKSVYDVS